jgi:hypothetical protein
MPDFDFQPYRDFILLDGDKQRALYTPTDALLPLQVGTALQQLRLALAAEGFLSQRYCSIAVLHRI